MRRYNVNFRRYGVFVAHITVENLCYTYEDGNSALNDISFSVEKGERLCIAGANGSGKSTLLELIAGCMKNFSGSIMITEGKTGLVFQEPDNQLFMPTVWEDVAFGIMKPGTTAEEGKKRSLEALRAVEAEDIALRNIHSLSGGEKQRAAIAGILAMESEILVLDEPTAALDPRARKNLIALLKKLPKTQIIASHDLDMINEIATKVLFLYKGRLVAQSPLPGLLHDEAFLQGIELELPLSVTRS